MLDLYFHYKKDDKVIGIEVFVRGAYGVITLTHDLIENMFKSVENRCKTNRWKIKCTQKHERNNYDWNWF